MAEMASVAVMCLSMKRPKDKNSLLLLRLNRSIHRLEINSP